MPRRANDKAIETAQPPTYRGRLAPSPSGYLHLGHARTFWTAYQRALSHNGTLILRNEDLDPQRSKREYATAMLEDLKWLGICWQEGPDCGGPLGPYSQSERRRWYLEAWRKLRQAGPIYPCNCSRKDLAEAAQAPHGDNDEAIYPGTCRSRASSAETPAGANWRFRVPDGMPVRFRDGAQGEQQFTAGRNFGDFIIWRRDDVPAYQLAVVVDDSAMGITEVVRGSDLLKSTGRQLLLLSALGLSPPAYYHCDLLTDAQGQRLAKRHDALSLRALRTRGLSPEDVRRKWMKLHPDPQTPAGTLRV
ncbi:MAG TPA: tRNA glutamyl-Q(34) synthetase GluQRS [Terriglobales bacterium]|nr:tRNA glutamyl-Q(34) synthetase GluQRS [Terriglobales bacterium]